MQAARGVGVLRGDAREGTAARRAGRGGHPGGSARSLAERGVGDQSAGVTTRYSSSATGADARSRHCSCGSRVSPR